METLTVKQFSLEANKIVATLRSKKHPIVLTQNNKPAVIIQSVVEFEKEKKAYLFLKLMVQGEQNIKSGKLTSQRKVFSDIRKRLSKDNGKI